MSFSIALELVLKLEGGKHKGDDNDSNDTNNGIIQATWEGLGYRGSVFDASDADIANCYHKLWSTGGASVYDPQTQATRGIFDLMPERADAFAFQFYINVPPGTFRKALQRAIGVEPDGAFGPKTLFALSKMANDDLLDQLERQQRQHYIDVAKPVYINGLLRRVDIAYKFCYNDA